VYDRAVCAARSSPERFLQLRVARVALGAAAPLGFALGGGHALRLHSLLRRPTEAVHLVGAAEGGVRAALGPVSAALAADGLLTAAPDEDLFEGMSDAYAELTVADPRDPGAVRLSLARLPRLRPPEDFPIGPVLHLDDLLAAKVCALATRSAIRDYVDVAAALGAGYDRARLLDLARRHDPALDDDELAAALRRLDALPDAPFQRYGVVGADVGELRRRFGLWPR
jgi:hypothetical protein